MPATANLLHRAAHDLPMGHPARPGLLIEAGEAMTQAGELAEADAVLAAAQSEAAALGDPALEVTAQLGLIYLHYLAEGDEPEAEVVARVEAAIDGPDGGW